MIPVPMRPFNAPSPMFTIGWGEDINLSGGAAVIATILSQVPDLRDGTDDILSPDKDLFIKRILYGDETVGDVDGAKLAADRPLGRTNSKTVWRAQNETSAEFPILVHEFPGMGFFIPKGTKLSATGSSSGSVAEQHVMLLQCHSPQFRPPLRVGNPNAAREFVAHGLKTGTLVAATISGKNDVLGHTAAFEDSENVFGVDERAQYVLYGCIARPGLAGVGTFGFLHPSGDYHVLWPSVFAADVPLVFMMDQPWAFNGTNKGGPKLVGAGAVTTSTEFQPLLAVL